MFGRYFFLILGVLSLGWITYVGLDLIDQKNNYSPFYLFGKEDRKILVVNKLKELDLQAANFKTSDKNLYLLSKLKLHLKDYKSVYVSNSRNHILVESKYNCSFSRVKDMLKKMDYDPKMESHKELSIEGFKVKIHRNKMYFYEDELSSTAIAGWEKFDRKSTASFIDFSKTKVSITDIYLKPNGSYEFKTENEDGYKGRQVNDRQLFSTYIPENIQSYHFIEKEYLLSSDNQAAKSPLADWLENGLVTIKIDDEIAIISDFKAGQNPIEVLTDLVNSNEEVNSNYGFFKNIQLTKDFPSNLHIGFYVYLMNDVVVISENSTLCEKIVTDYKLGNNLSSNEKLSSNIYSGLPKKVSERLITNSEKSSRTIYKSQILSTAILNNEIKEQKDETQDIKYMTTTMKYDGTLVDFLVLPGLGNCITLTEYGQLCRYEEGEKIWTKNYAVRPVGGLQLVDNNLILFSSSNSIHLLDPKGNPVGNIIKLNSPTTAEATFFIWKNKKHLTIPLQNGDILTYQMGKATPTSFNSNLKDLEKPLQVWISQGKLFYGAVSNSQFHMFEAEKKKEFRTFSVPNKSLAMVEGNQIQIAGIESGNLIKQDQKGSRENIKNVQGTFAKRNNKEDLIAILSGKTISIFDNFLNYQGQVSIPFSNPENISAISVNQRTIVSVVDGIENNVYLYELGGKSLNQKPLEGSFKALLQSESGDLLLSTLVDDYLIQYRIKF